MRKGGAEYLAIPLISLLFRQQISSDPLDFA
jgi:hypothetical protein